MSARQKLIATFAIALVGLFPALSRAAPPTVEIIAMAHPPVQSALKPLRQWLAGQVGKVHVIEIDAESASGEKRLETIGLKGHVPIVILIDGKTRFQRKNGSAVSFVNFPDVKESPAGIRGDWLTEDVEAAVVERLGKAGR